METIEAHTEHLTVRDGQATGLLAKHNTQRVLVCSTHHITLETDLALHSDSLEMTLDATHISNTLSYFTIEWGWLIYVSSGQEAAARSTPHTELADLIALALRTKHDWLRIEADCPTLPEELNMPEFEW